MMLNPKWTNFDTNFQHAVSVTSGSGATRFGNLWYGQPVSFDSYKGLLAELTTMFS